MKQGSETKGEGGGCSLFFTQRRDVTSEMLAALYMSVITGIAVTVGPFSVLFPELGALSYETLGRPYGRWGRAPLHLATSPALAGMIGIVVTRYLPYGPSSVLLTVTCIIALISILRSPIGPAISAGLLPLVLGITSWWYPPAILFGCLLLTVLVLLWKRIAWTRTGDEFSPHPSPIVRASAEEEAPSLPWRAGPTLAFTLMAVVLVLLTGFRFLLYPPLVVITYEMFSHPLSCPWAQRPLRLPVACFLAATVGFSWYCFFGVSVLTALSSMASGIVILRLLDLCVPPALAVALLPLVIESPTIAYPFSVGIGTALLSMWFLAWQTWVPRIWAQVMPTNTKPVLHSLSEE